MTQCAAASKRGEPVAATRRQAMQETATPCRLRERAVGIRGDILHAADVIIILIIPSWNDLSSCRLDHWWKMQHCRCTVVPFAILPSPDS